MTSQAGSISSLEVVGPKVVFSLVYPWSEIRFCSESQDQRLKIFNPDDSARKHFLLSLKLSKDFDLKWLKGRLFLFQSIPGRVNYDCCAKSP